MHVNLCEIKNRKKQAIQALIYSLNIRRLNVKGRFTSMGENIIESSLRIFRIYESIPKPVPLCVFQIYMS